MKRFTQYLQLIVALACVALPAGAGAKAADDKPLIAIIGDAWWPAFHVTENAVFDMLQSYEFITAEENAQLKNRQDLEGLNLTVFWVDTGYSYADMQLAIDRTINRSPDILLTFTSWLTEAAVNATRELENPPAIFFGAVEYPELYDIAESPCDKPAHVTGSESLAEYEYVLSLLKIQDPDLTLIGTMYSTAEEGGQYGAHEIATVASNFGIKVEQAPLTTLADVAIAADSLIDKGIGAFLLPWDTLTARGLPVVAIAANEVGIPVFDANMGAIYYGATIGAGFFTYYDDGIAVGRMLTAYLNDELDIALAGISRQSSQGIGVNLDAAFVQGIQIADEITAEVDAVIEGGDLAKASPEAVLALAREGVVVPKLDRIEADRAWLAALNVQ